MFLVGSRTEQRAVWGLLLAVSVAACGKKRETWIQRRSSLRIDAKQHVSTNSFRDVFWDSWIFLMFLQHQKKQFRHIQTNTPKSGRISNHRCPAKIEHWKNEILNWCSFCLYLPAEEDCFLWMFHDVPMSKQPQMTRLQHFTTKQNQPRVQGARRAPPSQTVRATRGAKGGTPFWF